MDLNDKTLLQIIAKKAIKNSQWVEFANFCNYRIKGVRKQAFQHLNSFLASTQKWSLDQKKEFLAFLLPFYETTLHIDYGVFPQPLSNQLIKTTLEQWCKEEDEDNRAFRWLGKFYKDENTLLKALDIDPKDDLSRETLINWWVYNLYGSIHQLPISYLGEPTKDLNEAEKIKTYINKLTDSNKKKYWSDKLNDHIIIINNYIDWKRSSHPDLVTWGKKTNKKVGF